MDRPSPELVDCPHCGVKNPAIDQTCGSCHQELAIYIGPRPKVKTCGLADGMWWIAAFALCFGLLRADLFLGSCLSIILLPSLLRTLLSVSERKLDARPMGRDEIVRTFFMSVAIVFFAVFGSLAAAGVTGLLLSQIAVGPVQFWFPCVLMALVASATAALMLRRFWPRRD